MQNQQRTEKSSRKKSSISFQSKASSWKNRSILSYTNSALEVIRLRHRPASILHHEPLAAPHSWRTVAAAAMKISDNLLRTVSVECVFCLPMPEMLCKFSVHDSIDEMFPLPHIIEFALKCTKCTSFQLATRTGGCQTFDLLWLCTRPVCVPFP